MKRYYYYYWPVQSTRLTDLWHNFDIVRERFSDSASKLYYLPTLRSLGLVALLCHF